MKNFFVILTALLLALMLGCQENQMTEPVSSALNKDKVPEVKSIKICCELKDLTYRICQLNGRVNYSHNITSRTMNPGIGLCEVAVSLYINAMLCDKTGAVHLEWRVEGRSDEIITVSEDGIYLLDKIYSISNRNDAVLFVKYLVTADGVGIASVELVPLERK